MRKENKGAKVVADALTGLDCQAFLVNGRRYVMRPPTIKRLALAGAHLSGFDTGDTLAELLAGISDMERLSKALSCFIQGDEGLTKELSEGRPEEVVKGLELAYSMLDPQVFIKAVSLARNVATLIARPK